MGLLRIMQLKQPYPYANPIEFTWRELMEVMGLSAGGGNLHHLKEAIRSIEGTRIRSKFALKNANGQHLKSRETELCEFHPSGGRIRRQESVGSIRYLGCRAS